MRTLITIFIFYIVLMVPTVLLAENKPQILVINSDISLGKYRVAHEEFKKAVGFPVVEMVLDKSNRSSLDAIRAIETNSYPLIYCVGSKAYLLANRHAKDTNILFSSLINWLRFPTTHNTYGVSNELHTGMQIMLFRYIFPDVKKIGVLYSEKFNRQWFENARYEAKRAGVEIIGESVRKLDYTTITLQKLLNRIDAFWLISDPLIISNKSVLIKILKICDSNKIPVYSYNDVYLRYGAVLTVSVDNPTIGRQAAGIAEKLLQEVPIEEKVQFPAGSHISLNLKKVKEYGLTYSDDALGSVNRIIE